MRRHRLVLLQAAALIAGLGVAGAQPAGAACSGVRHYPGGWTRVAPPAPSATSTATGRGAPALAALTVVPGRPTTFLTTDGAAIFRSGDGGCSWQTVYQLGADVPEIGLATYTIADLSAPSRRGQRSGTAYAVLIAGLAPSAVGILAVMPPTLVLRTTDSGKSWALVPEVPTPSATDRPRCINSAYSDVSPVDPALLYVWCPTGLVDNFASIATNPADAAPLWRSDDGGASWARVHGAGQMVPHGYAADPLSRNRLWAVGLSQTNAGSDVYTAAMLSDDGGASWTVRRVPKPGLGDSPSIAVGVLGGHRNVVVSSSAGTWLSTDANAKVWKQLNQPKLAEPMVAVPRPGGGLTLAQTSRTACATDLQVRLLTTRMRQLPATRQLPQQFGHVRALTSWSGTPEGGVVGLADVTVPNDAACRGAYPQSIAVWAP